MCYEPKSCVSSFRNDFKVSYKIKTLKYLKHNPSFFFFFNGLIHCDGAISRLCGILKNNMNSLALSLSRVLTQTDSRMCFGEVKKNYSREVVTVCGGNSLRHLYFLYHDGKPKPREGV